MLSWISSSDKSSNPQSGSSQSSKSRAGPCTPTASSSTPSIPQYATKISVEIPSYKIEATDFNVGYEVDLEKMGEFTPNYSRPIKSDHHPNNTTDFLDDEDIIDQPSFGHKLFDAITRHAGSRYVLFVTIVLLMVWILIGAFFGPSEIWQITIQNASSIQVYLTDILLIRQQHTSSRSLLKTISKMQSRDQTFARLIQKIPQTPSISSKEAVASASQEPKDISSLSELVPPETDSSRSKEIFDESCRMIASGLGSVWAYMIYWAGIIAWVGTGKLYEFSDVWQLYINSAVAVALTFTSIFLQNRQQQQEDALDRALEYSMKIDKQIEFRLREMTGDRTANPVVLIETPKLGWIEKGIDLFALMMGSLIGVIITLIFLIIWVIIGPPLQYSADWWLIFGTFTGLIGFIDGFILRNIYAREASTVNSQLEKVAAIDSKVFQHAHLSHVSPPENKLSLSSRISGKIGDWCASPHVTLASVLFVIALLAVATEMRWTTTGQLLCNTPTMIIEGFLLLVLIEAHCIADEIRERHLRNILERRLILNRHLRETMVEKQMMKPEPVVIEENQKKLSERMSEEGSLRSSSEGTSSSSAMSVSSLRNSSENSKTGIT